MKIARLDQAIQTAGIPIFGVSGNQASVRVDFKPEATGPQQATAASIVAAFDWSDAAQLTYEAQQRKVEANAGIDAGDTQAGDKLERLVRALALVTLDEVNRLRAAVPHPIVSITRASTTATVTTGVAHGLAANDTVVISGAAVAAYNGLITVVATPSGTTFTYTVAGSPASPATGSISYSRAVVAALPDLTAAQLVTAIKAKVNSTPE